MVRSALDKFKMFYEDVVPKGGWHKIINRRKASKRMAGTSEGAKKMVATNIKKHGDDYMSKIGRRGGKNAQKLHPELQRFRDKKFAVQAQIKSTKARKAKKANKP